MNSNSNYCDYPKVLIIGRSAWTKNNSALSGVFNGYMADRLAYICIETREPSLDKCEQHFQISETAMIKKLLNWKIRTGNVVSITQAAINHTNEKQEQIILRNVRSHRSIVYLFLRELLWWFGGWRSKELNSFIDAFQADVVFCLGDPLPLMNRLQRYVIDRCKKPGVIFMMDDIYSYTTCKQLSKKMYRWLLRRQVIPLIKKCKAHFAISPKMKNECDMLFGTNCVILTKGIDCFAKPLQHVHFPIVLVYTGNLLYGRLYTLSVIANTIRRINEAGDIKALLHVYTQTELDDKQRAMIDIPEVSKLHKPVAYSDLNGIYETSDIVLFVESLQEQYKYIARLSFSTKITDYLACGRCIFAVGAENIAPIEYLKSAGIAITCSNYDEIEEQLRLLLSKKDKIVELANCSSEYGKRFHNSNVMRDRLQTTINSLVSNNK